jgi:hypothetical protein
MSQSENSEDSMATACPVEYVDMTSIREESEEEEEELATSEPTTLITQEEIETMLKCAMESITNNSEIMNILLRMIREIGINKKEENEENE